MSPRSTYLRGGTVDRRERTRASRCMFACMLALVTSAPAFAHPDSDGQIGELSRAIEQSPTATLHLKRGELHRSHRDYGAALADFEAAARLAPGMYEVLLSEGRVLFEAGHAAPARL